MRQVYILLVFLCLGMVTGGDTFGQSATDTGAKVQLKEVLVKPKTYQYEKDTAENRQLYKQSFRTLTDKPKLGLDRGLVVNGLFSNIAYILSGKRKAARQFTNQLIRIEEQKLIDSRYTSELTSRLTTLSNDSLVMFMNANPMSFEFAKTASDLALKMWIREQYRNWQEKRK